VSVCDEASSTLENSLSELQAPLDWIAPLQILCKILDSGIFLCASLAMYIKMTLKDMQDLTFR
jgi:hypothetical protein